VLQCATKNFGGILAIRILLGYRPPFFAWSHSMPILEPRLFKQYLLISMISKKNLTERVVKTTEAVE